jgi:hypothetical protein
MFLQKVKGKKHGGKKKIYVGILKDTEEKRAFSSVRIQRSGFVSKKSRIRNSGCVTVGMKQQVRTEIRTVIPMQDVGCGTVPLQDVGYLSLYEMFSVEGKKVPI